MRDIDLFIIPFIKVQYYRAQIIYLTSYFYLIGDEVRLDSSV